MVLDGLERIERRITDIDRKIDQEITVMESKFDQKNGRQDEAIKNLEVEVGKLKVWATLSGAIAAAVVTALAQFLFRVAK